MVTLAFKHQEQYEHVGPAVTRSQEGKDYKMANRDYAWLMILRSSKDHIQDDWLVDVCHDMYKPDIAFAVDKLSSYTILEGYTDVSLISNAEDNSSTSGWVFLLGEAPSHGLSRSKLASQIPFRYKPITPIYICCDSAATLAKAYSQMYNEKSKHLGVRHNMIRELLTNAVISIGFLRRREHIFYISSQGCAQRLKGYLLNGLKFEKVQEQMHE
ncbi:hypothetical protein Tco_0052396 [Tanacetum coccineum]